ncbi:hypothetical protein FO519_009388 [Halicephalobus sp. NKZ332]|nr:hypothetical protein FO519_009388 [Halicephalobus sp. NKZ332]
MSRDISAVDCFTNKEFRKFEEHLGPVTNLKALQGCLFLSSSKDKNVRLWDVRVLKSVKAFQMDDNSGPTAPVMAVDSSGSCLTLGSASSKNIHSFDISSGRLVSKNPLGGPARGLIFSPSERILATVSENFDLVDLTQIPPKLSMEEGSGKEPKNCPFELSNEKTLFEGPWLIGKQVDFKLKGTNNHGVWQSAHRTRRGNKLGADGVDIVGILYKDSKEYYILVKQYRIPIGKWILEFPAGLVDASDTSIESAGIREFKEETGYTATEVVRCTKKGQYLNPGISSDSSSFLLVKVDGSLPENQNPEQNLEGDESIEVVLVEAGKFLEYLDEVTESGEVEVCTQVYAWALAKVFP